MYNPHTSIEIFFRDSFKGVVALEIIIDLPFGFFPINNIISVLATEPIHHKILFPPLFSRGFQKSVIHVFLGGKKRDESDKPAKAERRTARGLSVKKLRGNSGLFASQRVACVAR